MAIKSTRQKLNEITIGRFIGVISASSCVSHDGSTLKLFGYRGGKTRTFDPA
jgi:hypothetical protein